MGMSRRTGVFAIALAAAALAAPAGAQARAQVLAHAAAPDRAYRTPVAHGAAAAHSSVTRTKLATGLGKLFRRVGKSGAFVFDPATDQVLFSRQAGRPRILASNSKIFTTSTALARFQPDGHLQTQVISSDPITDGISQGLYLRGGGDPLLSSSDLVKIAARVRAAGVTTVQGPLFYDNTFLDGQTSVPEHGISFEGVGTLSGLELDRGSSSDPAKTAAQRFEDDLHKAGVSMGSSVTPGIAPLGGTQVTTFDSIPMSAIVQDTNVPSDNYLAEMLLKDVGAQSGNGGSTAGGIAAVQHFASQNGASFQGENGSGLTRLNRASPASVVKLLDSMIEVDRNTSPDAQAAQEALRDAWTNSLAIAGHTGTVANRMRGTAASGRCRLKTGTLDRVSALSGYCFNGGADAEHAVVFSLLMNNVDVNRAHVIQDRMAALIARFRH
jgi:D-alanyl-D-alanine carboxypeptidase/D-alanyl-D-alanine-endopeptidase (penicillin-binding protein 4)